MRRASSIHRDRLCNGAPAACEGIPDIAERSWTGDGRIIHDALKDDSKMKELDDDLFDVAEALASSASYIIDKIFPEGSSEKGHIVRERDEPFLVIHDGTPIISGHPDFIQYGTINDARVALILDFKSGFLEVPSPECNDQLRAYSVAVWQESQKTDEPLDEVYASIIPRFGRATPVKYTSADLPMALLDLVELDEIARDANAIRTPSVEACRYCRARATSRCPETLYPPVKLSRMKSLIELTPAEKGELLTLSKVVQGNIKALTDRLYEELQGDSSAVAGWELVPGKVAKNIENVAACYAQVEELLEVAEYQKCLKVQKKRLVTAIKDELFVRENLKGKSAEKRVADILDPVIIPKQGKDVLVPKGATVELESA